VFVVKFITCHILFHIFIVIFSYNVNHVIMSFTHKKVKKCFLRFWFCVRCSLDTKPKNLKNCLKNF